MAFVLDVALEGEQSIQQAIARIGKTLEDAGKEAQDLSIAAEKAVKVIGTDYAKAAANAGAATGSLVKGLEAEAKLLQETWQKTQKYNNVLRDQQKLQQLVHKSSKDYSTALEQQIMQMTHAGMRTAYLREAEMKLAEQHIKLQAEASLFNTTMAQTVRGMEAQLKAAKATEESDRKRTQRVKDLTAELKHLSTQEGKDALLLEHKIKLAKEAALAETKRKERIGALRSELRYLASEEGKKAESLALQVKRSKEAAVAEEQRKNRLKDLRAELRQLSTEEAKKAASLELAIKRQKELATADERRKNKLKDLRAEIRFLNSEAGKKTASEELTLKRTKELATQEQRRANRLKDLRAELRYLKSEQGQLAAELELSVKRQKELVTEDQRRKNRLKDLRAELKHLNSDEGKRALSIERQIKRQKELAGQEDARRNRIKDLRAELAYLNSAEGKRGAVLEQQLRGQRELVVEEEKRRQTLQKLRAELDYLKTEEGKRQELMKAEIALKRQLIQEQVKQSSELAKARAARDQYNSATQRNIELARLELAEKKKADKAWAEEQLGIKKTTVAVNDHSDSIRKLKAEIQFLQTAQGKEFMELERQKRQLKQTRDELLKAGTATDRFKRSVRELTTAVNLSNQATAGFRAGLAGIGTSFGMFTSSTILFASAVYGVGSALKSSIQAGAEFESQMDRVNAIMDASGANTIRLTEEVRSLAENTVFTAREVSDGLMYLGMAGLKTEDALTALEPSLRLASIGMLDMGTTADIVTNIMVGMGLEAGQISEIVDDMATAITNSNMDVRQLGNAMSYVAPLAREADISLQEITASLEVLHNTGIKASRAGTAMRTSMLSLLAPTAEAMEVLQRYGIQVDDNSGRMRNWTELLTEMANAQMTLSDIEAIVGKRQAAGLKAMIDSAKATEAAAEKAKKLGIEVGKSASELKVLTQQLHENAGAAKIMQSIMEDNLRGDWLKLQAAIEEKYLEFYDMNKEELRYLVQAATDFVKSLDIKDINEQFRTMAGWIAEIVQLLAAAKAGMFALGAVNMIGTGVNAAASYGALGAEWLRGRKASKSGNPVQLYTGLKQQTDNRMLAGMIMSGSESRKYTQTIPGALASTGQIVSSVTPIGAGRTLLAKGLQYGLQGLSVGAAGYGAYSMMNSGGDYLENNFGLGREGVDYAMENRLSRYRDMEADQLIAEYNSIQGALETTATAYAMAQEELHKHLALENLEEADKVRSTMEQQTRQAEELARALQAAGIAKEESGLFGSQAEAEMALASAGAEYLTMQASFQNLSKLFVEGKISAEALEQAQEGVRVKQAEVARLAETVNTYKAQTIKHEQALKAANEDTANKSAEVVQSYRDQKAELLGQVSLQDKLKAVRAERLQLEQEYLGEEQKGLSNTNNAKERALKLLQQEERIKGQIAQQNDRAVKDEQRANEQAAKSLEQTLKRKEALESQYASIEYINAAYERGVLLLDDEEYQRELAIKQQERQIRLAEEQLSAAIALGKVGEEGIADLEDRVKVEKEILILLGRQKVELSEAARFGQQQVASLESMYSTIESETIGLLERGFKDTESYFDSIVGSFKRMLAELAYQAAIKPIIVNMVASVGGMMGMDKAANAWAGEQGVTVGGGMGNLVEMGKSAWDFWKGGGQADVSWFNDFATSGMGQSLGLSTAGTTTIATALPGGGQALASALPGVEGALMSAVPPPAGSFQAISGGSQVISSTAPVMSQGASLFSQGLSYSPWGALGAIGGSLLGVQGAENPWVNTAFTTGGSILGGMAGAAIAGGSGAAAGATAGSWAGPVGAAIGAVLGMALGGSLFGGDKSYRMTGSIYTYDEADKSPHYTYHPTAPDSEEINAVTAFGKSSIHINKYGKVEDWQEALDALVSLDALIASGMSEAEISAAKTSVEGFERGGQRGDQARMEEFLYDRYSIISETANHQLSKFVQRNTDTTTDLVKSFSILNALSKDGTLPSTMGGFVTLKKDTDEGLFDSVARNATQAAFYQQAEGFSIPDISNTLTGASVDWSAGISEVIGQALVQPEGLEGRAKEFADLFITAVTADLEYVAESANYDFSGDLSAQLDQIIADAIASLSSKDGLSAQILGEFIGRDIYEAFKQGSETQLETVNRVVGSFEAISGAFDKLGLEIDEVGLDALDLTERMIKLAGGFEVLTTNLDAYYQNFYSEEERAANTMAELTEALESLGYGIPGTRAAFRGLVEELERAGNLEGFTTLINSNGSFAQFYAQMEQWTASLFETYRNTIGRDPSAMELYRWLDKLKTGEALFSDVVKSLTTGISDATANLSQQDIESLQSGAQDIYDAYQYTLEIAQEEHALALERIGQEENLLKSLRTLIDNLKLSDISPLTPAERLAEAQRQYASILAAVEGGDFSRAGELDSAAQAYLGEASSYYASSATYEGIFNNVLGSLESLEAQYGTSLSYEDRKEQLDNQLLATQDRAKSLLEDQLKALADSYQLDQSILSVLSLLPSELANAIAQVLPESLGGVGADYSDQSKFSLEGLSLDGIDSRIIDLYNNLLGRAPDAEGAYYWQQQMAGGMSIQEMTSHFLYEIERLGLLNGPGAANGISVPQVDQDAYDRYKNFANGSHFGGIESVPFDGYKAILHRGEKVIPASSAKDDEKLALITEIRALRAEVTQLREDQNRNAQRAEETAVVASNMSAQIISQSTKDAIESKSVADRAKVTMR
jgi:TP901 family phage tail tape measure protein